MVVARQRPETAKGIVFMLFEDERGTVNLIVPPSVYERHRALVRAAPLLRARGRLERREGVTNVLVSEVPSCTAPPPSNPPTWASIPADERRARAAAPSPSCAPSPRPATAGAGGGGERSAPADTNRQVSP